MSLPSVEQSHKERPRSSKARSVAKKLLLAFYLFVIIFAAWNWATLASLSQPQFHAIMVAIGKQPATPDYQADQNRFVFPRLAIDAPFTESPSSSPLNFQDWDSIRTALTKGVSLNYSTSTLDGAKLAYVTGHSSDTYPHPYSSVFASLGQAKVGDQFVITGHGEIRTYKVVSSQVVNPRNVLAFSEANLAGGSSTQRVAVVTCWPLLTNLNRLVVLGERVTDDTKLSYTGGTNL
ncbi:MAG: sortase [bacterium]